VSQAIGLQHVLKSFMVRSFAEVQVSYHLREAWPNGESGRRKAYAIGVPMKSKIRRIFRLFTFNGNR